MIDDRSPGDCWLAVHWYNDNLQAIVRALGIDISVPDIDREGDWKEFWANIIAWRLSMVGKVAMTPHELEFDDPRRLRLLGTDGGIEVIFDLKSGLYWVCQVSHLPAVVDTIRKLSADHDIPVTGIVIAKQTRYVVDDELIRPAMSAAGFIEGRFNAFGFFDGGKGGMWRLGEP